MSYIINFNGTSKFAPMITGIIFANTEQITTRTSQLKMLKLMIVNSATYSKTKDLDIISSSFSEITSTYEH